MTKNGFTLIEMMVAVSIFSIVAVIVSGALITVMSINRQAQATKIVVDNLRFAMDSMVMRLRDGTNYHCLTSNPSSLSTGSLSGLNCGFDGSGSPEGVAIVFNSKRVLESNMQIGYRLITNGDGVGVLQIGTQAAEGFIDMTSREIDVESLQFHVVGYDPGDVPPRVGLSIQARTVGKVKTEFHLETVVDFRT